MNDILEKVSNFVVECSDGRRIKCDKFTMLRYSGVFRRMYDDLGDLDPPFELKVPVHSSDVTRALEMTHGIVGVPDLVSLEECDACMRGIQYLELDAETDAILERMLGMCASERPGLSTLTEYAHWFFGSVFFATRFLSVLLAEESSFRGVSQVVRGIHIRLDVLQAMFAMFLKLYPAQPVVALFVDAMDPAARTAENVLALLDHRMAGFNVHPLELNRIAEYLLGTDILDPVTRRFAEFTKQATTAGQDGDAATCVTLDSDTCLSIVVHGDFDDTVSVNVGECLRLTLDEDLESPIDFELCETVLGRSCYHTVQVALVSRRGDVVDAVYDADHIFEKEQYAGRPYPVSFRLSDFVQKSGGASLREMYKDRWSDLDYVKIVVRTRECIFHA
jgi:hypothetical protein